MTDPLAGLYDLEPETEPEIRHVETSLEDLKEVDELDVEEALSASDVDELVVLIRAKLYAGASFVELELEIAELGLGVFVVGDGIRFNRNGRLVLGALLEVVVADWRKANGR